MRTTKEAILLLNKLSTQNVDYALIRNFDCLINNKPYNEKDIDVVVRKKGKKKICPIMKHTGYKKLLICPSAGHEGYAKYINGHFLSFHFHIGGVSGSHIPYLDAESILARKQEKKGLFIVSTEDKLLALLMHALIDSNTIKKRYINELTVLTNRKLDWQYINETLNKRLSQEITQKILYYLRQRNYARLEKISRQVKINFKFNTYSKYMHYTYSILMRNLWGIWRRTRNAPLICFIGMDGAGKSTATRLLKERLDRSLITNALIYTGRGRNNILPIQFFGKIRAFPRKTNNLSNSPKEKKRLFQKIIYTLSSLVFALDLLLRYWLVIWPKRKTKQIVFTDRYSTDILLMKNVPMLIKQLLHLFFPKPTRIIYLYNTIGVLHKRKPEHPIDDLYRQQRIFAELNKQIQPVMIKTKNIDETVETISKIVIDSI